jgi:hypothetical protein
MNAATNGAGGSQCVQQIQDIIDALARMDAEAEDKILIDTSGLPDPPPPL